MVFILRRRPGTLVICCTAINCQILSIPYEACEMRYEEIWAAWWESIVWYMTHMTNFKFMFRVSIQHQHLMVYKLKVFCGLTNSLVSTRVKIDQWSCDKVSLKFDPNTRYFLSKEKNVNSCLKKVYIGHETMVCAVYLSIFLWMHLLYFLDNKLFWIELKLNRLLLLTLSFSSQVAVVYVLRNPLLIISCLE